MNKCLSVVFLVLCLLSVSRAGVSQPPDEYLRYEEFIRKVEGGEVVSVQLGEYSQITGTYKSGDVEKAFHSYHDDSHSDPLLLSLLREKEVSIQVAEEEEPYDSFGFFSLGIMFVIPLVTFIYAVRINSKVERLLRAQSENGSQSADSLP